MNRVARLIALAAVLFVADAFAIDCKPAVTLGSPEGQIVGRWLETDCGYTENGAHSELEPLQGNEDVLKYLSWIRDNGPPCDIRVLHRERAEKKWKSLFAGSAKGLAFTRSEYVEREVRALSARSRANATAALNLLASSNLGGSGPRGDSTRRAPLATARGIQTSDWQPARVVQFDIDQAHSSITFLIRHSVSKVHGRFNVFAGRVSMDPRDPTTLVVLATISSASLDTNSQQRDAHLRSQDFFDVARYPEIEFKSSRAFKQGKELKIAGDLTIRGVTRQVVLDVDKFDVDEGMGRTRVGLQATGRVDRRDWGIDWNRRVAGTGDLLGNDVDMTIRMQAIASSSQEAAAK